MKPIFWLCLLALAGCGLAAPTATPTPRPTARPTSTPAAPVTLATGEGQGAQAGRAFTVPTEGCGSQALSYAARLAETGVADAWIELAVVDDDRAEALTTPRRDVLAYPDGTFGASLAPGESYRVVVRGRHVTWRYTLDCVP